MLVGENYFLTRLEFRYCRVYIFYGFIVRIRSFYSKNKVTWVGLHSDYDPLHSHLW